MRSATFIPPTFPCPLFTSSNHSQPSFPFPFFPFPFPFVSFLFLGTYPLPHSDAKRLQIRLHGPESAVSCQQGPARNSGPQRHFCHTLSPRNLPDGNCIGSFCIDQSGVIEDTLAMCCTILDKYSSTSKLANFRLAPFGNR